MAIAAFLFAQSALAAEAKVNPRLSHQSTISEASMQATEEAAPPEPSVWVDPGSPFVQAAVPEGMEERNIFLSGVDQVAWDEE